MNARASVCMVVAILGLTCPTAGAQQVAEERDSFVRVEPGIEATEFQDSLGDFQATYSVSRMERGRAWRFNMRDGVIDSGVRDVLATGKMTVARRGDWIVLTYELVEPNPDAVGGMTSSVDRYFLHGTRLIGYQHDGAYSENPDPQMIGFAQPPFSTDLGYLWKGDAFVPPGEVEAHLMTRGFSAHQTVIEEGVKRTRSEHVLPRSSPESCQVTLHQVTARKVSGELVGFEGGRAFEFPDGQRRALADNKLEVQRYLDGLAAGFSVKVADLTAQSVMPLPTSAAAFDSWRDANPEAFLPKFSESYELISLEPLQEGDRVTPADFAPDISTVALGDLADGNPLWTSERQQKFTFDETQLRWLPVSN